MSALKSSRDSRMKMEKGESAPLIDRALSGKHEFLNDVEFKAVETVEELKAAARITYQEYLKCRYIPANANGLKLALFQTIPSTVTFIARRKDGRVLGTVSIVEDSPLGLPSDKIYWGEFNSLRLEEHRLAEVTMLALDREILEQSEKPLKHSERLLLLIHLLKVMFDYLRTSTKVDELVAAFHPQHESFYKFLQLEPLGDFKAHASVKGSPAIARHLNIQKTQTLAHNHLAYKIFFDEAVSEKNFERRLKFSEEEIRHLFVEHLNILASAEAEKLAYIKSCYPDYNLDRLIQSKPLLQHLIESIDQKSYEDDGGGK